MVGQSGACSSGDTSSRCGAGSCFAVGGGVHHNEEEEDGSLCWRLLSWLCCGQLVVEHNSLSGEEGWL